MYNHEYLKNKTTKQKQLNQIDACVHDKFVGKVCLHLLHEKKQLRQNTENNTIVYD